MTENIQELTAAQPRVVTRPGSGGAAVERRRRFQRHLLLFIAGNLAIAGADVLTSPGIQWAQWLVMPWVFVLFLHVLGLKSRGFTLGELLTPPKQRVVKKEPEPPLHYELVRARQLRDGLASAAESVRARDADIADAAMAAADELLAAVERAVAAARARDGETPGPATAEIEPELQAALTTLDQLHQGTIGVEVLDGSPESLPIQEARRRAEELRKLS